MIEMHATTMTSRQDDVCYFPVERQRWADERERAEDAFDIPLGASVTAGERGRRWVFIGWDRNTAGLYPRFVEERTPDRFGGIPLADYHAVFVDTLLRKFPDLERFRKRSASAT